MTVDEFLRFVKTQPNRWISYCEILIQDNGDILLARPSHQEALLNFASVKMDMTRDELMKIIPVDYAINEIISDKYNIAIIWYDYCIITKRHSKEQKETIRRLLYEGLLSEHIRFRITREYEIYQERYIGDCKF